MKSSSTKKKTFKTKKTATSQPIQASSIPSIPILNLVDNNDPIILEDNITVDKDSLSSSQYTVFYTVKLNEKTVKKNLKVYQLNEEIKSFM